MEGAFVGCLRPPPPWIRKLPPRLGDSCFSSGGINRVRFKGFRDALCPNLSPMPRALPNCRVSHRVGSRGSSTPKMSLVVRLPESSAWSSNSSWFHAKAPTAKPGMAEVILACAPDGSIRGFACRGVLRGRLRLRRARLLDPSNLNGSCRRRKQQAPRMRLRAHGAPSLGSPFGSGI